jgi:hypothetical protein
MTEYLLSDGASRILQTQREGGLGVRLVSRIASVACAWQQHVVVVVVAQKVYVGSSAFASPAARQSMARLVSHFHIA